MLPHRLTKQTCAGSTPGLLSANLPTSGEPPLTTAVESHVVDAASILTSRRRRRAKTDRIDGETLVRTLMAYKAWRAAGVFDG